MINLKLVQDQPRWRVGLLHLIARAIGVQFKVDGWPFGSPRNRRPTSTDCEHVGALHGTAAIIAIPARE